MCLLVVDLRSGSTTSPIGEGAWVLSSNPKVEQCLQRVSPVLILMFLIGLEARSNRSRMRELLSRIEKLMSPLRHRAHGLRNFSPPDNGKCGLSEELRFCRPTCEPSCAELHPTCPATCGLAVCMCQRGFVRQSGMCIPMSACKFFDLEPLTRKKVEKRIDSPKSFVKKPPAKPPVINKASSTAILHRPLHPPPNCGQGQQFTRCVCDATCTRSKVRNIFVDFS
ncbi:hypothetical protein Y032_0026g1319 [Ancylostoma ceylanicum]|uniref:TIL domain-containing protein n=1 Tax=Ancylostoma ceylanicum TaxID=53326 RepID=A0A016UU44_9BILA|nr:hypothetical protein Y032_0026g1319 [Ancylostoma ceylanicum]